METWETIEEKKSYMGDFYNHQNRLVMVLVNSGIAVFAKCDIEQHYLMKDDFKTYENDLSFIQAASIENGIAIFSRECEDMFHEEVIEEITKKMYETI
jgi:hypothetical protein